MIYYKYIFLFFVTLALSSNSFAQNKEEIIENIKEEIEDIHLDTALKSVTLQNQEFLQNMPDGGGELTGFYKGNKIYRIYRSVGISYGVEITEFYYWKKHLIFVREKFNSYVYDDNLKTFDYTKMNTSFSGYYYFNNEKLIDFKITGHKKFEDQTLDREKTLLTESNDALKLITYKIKSQQDSLK